MYSLDLEILLIHDRKEARLSKTVQLPFVPFPGLVVSDGTMHIVISDVWWNVASASFSHRKTAVMDKRESFEREIEIHAGQGWKVVRI